MSFVNHAIAWCRGEIFEGRMYGLFGLLVLLLDHFSEIRADIYHRHIINYLGH